MAVHFFAKIIKYASRAKGNKTEPQIRHFPGCIKCKGALSRDGMLDVQEDWGDVHYRVGLHEHEKIAFPKDIVLAVVLLHVRGEVVQDVFLQLVPHVTRACDV